MRRIALLGLAASAALLLTATGCGNDESQAPLTDTSAAASYNADAALRWFEMSLRLAKETPGFSPPVASRALGYQGVTLYEALVPGMPNYRSLAGLANGLDPLPAPEHGAEYHWPTVANAALARAARLFYPTATAANQAAIDSLEAAMQAEVEGGVRAEVVARSISRGQVVADAIFLWSLDDGGHEGFLHNTFADYVPPAGPGLWTPTAPGLGAALQPYWGANRPFVLPDDGNPIVDCDPGAPAAFSTDPSSECYLEALEVYDTVNALTAEQLTIANFWADNPGVTATPPGHSLAILNQVIALENADLEVAAEAYARVGMAVADAFIACWYTKYTYNLLRPITYVQANIDAGWVIPLTTPAFPEYTSGHSVQSGAAAEVLTELFGDDYAFVDHTHDARGLPSRAFDSFHAAADEAALSRLYGGIHFRAAIERGVVQGRTIGDKVLAVTLTSR